MASVYFFSGVGLNAYLPLAAVDHSLENISSLKPKVTRRHVRLKPFFIGEFVRVRRISIDNIVQVAVPNLKTKFTPSGISNFKISANGQGDVTSYTKLIGEDDVVLYGELLFVFWVTLFRLS